MPEAGLPPFFELAAPPAWRAIDFISDLHLCQALPRTFDAFAAHLLHTPADAVFILGDLFEAWVGDDMGERGFELRCVELIAEAASHRQLAFMVGNRDFLVGARFLRSSGCMGLPDPTVLDAWGQRVLLSHGDALCIADTPYQTFRAEVRSAAWQAGFLAKPLCERLQIAADIRKVSRAAASSMAPPTPMSISPPPCNGCTAWARARWCTATRTGPAARRWHRATSAMCSATGTWTRAAAPRC